MRPTPMPPGDTSPSFMLTSGIMPPSGVKLSWPESTAPVDVPVVDAANSPDEAEPKRTSLLSMLPPAWSADERLVDAPPGQLGVAVLLEQPGHERRRSATATTMTASTTRPWRLLPTICAVGDREGEPDDEQGEDLEHVRRAGSGSRTGGPSWR